ncbi:PepSY domain-containing protein [Sphingomonas sp. ID1715]|uniref:PepSY domain-containing protein n=1 Tax=Sphingomonas sp. ID1715 TaxID=1656898 RepID=UPI0014880065|nr:PepSY domain-containing protein [Sphingomonas sp. ID1715]NNM77016.1 PepSY domain-containing protein [Sphingomonas sp. ID1715]
MRAGHRTFHRLHVWLGWVVAVPLLLWTVTGLWMAARPVEEVRGEDLRAPTVPLAYSGTARWPDTRGRTLKSLTVESRPGGPVWVASFTTGEARRADLATGRLLPKVSGEEATLLARASYLGSAAVDEVTRTPANHPPLDLRKPRPAWRVSFADGAHVYVDAETGAVLALRTRQWRLYDFMWGLHILDPRLREDTSHPLLIGLAVIGVLGTATGTALLFTRRRRRRNPKAVRP